jgi:hypothetical protein
MCIKEWFKPKVVVPVPEGMAKNKDGFYIDKPDQPGNGTAIQYVDMQRTSTYNPYWYTLSVMAHSA